MNTSLQIDCPHCGHQFPAQAAMEQHIRAAMEKEYHERLGRERKKFEEEVNRKAATEFQSKLIALEQEMQRKSERLQELEKRNVDLEVKERALLEREAWTELEIKKRMLAEESRIRKEQESLIRESLAVEFEAREQRMRQEKEMARVEARREARLLLERVREEEQLRYAELQKRFEDQKRLAEEMKRKADQGSMQLQGEVQELAIEAFLTAAFPKDTIAEVAKGARGADCLQEVRDHFGHICGRILYESKRTKSFGREWIAKMKDDMRLKQADIGLIVTESLPAELARFGQIDGVWVCTFAEFKSVAMLLRFSIIKIGEVMAAQENKGDKMQMLYDYLTGNEFRQRLDAIREAFEQMYHDLQKERAQSVSAFARREKQIYKVMENTVALYGEVRGIAGTSVPAIEALETNGEDLLIHSN